MILGREPVLWLGLVQAVVLIITVFVVDLTNEQIGAINLVAVAALSFAARSQVTPVGKEVGPLG